MSKRQVYFPNLNGLRFIAAFLVIIHHIEQYKHLFGYSSYWDKVIFIDIIGKLGVVLFFVLSGFLITYLLLTEEEATSNINVKNFYMRRVLRIWPLYFLIVFIALIVLPNFEAFISEYYPKSVIQDHLLAKILLYVFFLPNAVFAIYGIIPFAVQTWSIGTEEQFYLIWPILIKKIKKHRIKMMLFVLLLHFVILHFLHSHYSKFIPYKTILRDCWNTFNINCMAIGGIFGVLLFQKSKLLRFLNNNYLFYITILVTTFLIDNSIRPPYFFYELYSFLFGIIILNFASNPHIHISLENKLLNYLGNISYGIYMYHTIAIVIVLRVCERLNLITNWVIYPLSILLTVFIAGISYKYFESFFLKFKHNFSSIVSGSVKEKK